MIVFKCKMCGGTLEVAENQGTAVCEYCGTNQTLPKLADERRINLYDRANHFRRNNEFDKAAAIYERILNEEPSDAESYWSLVLCRYGIEYVEDPATHKRVPTVNRAQFTSIFDDDNYKSALKYSDIHQKSIYQEEAAVINEIQKGILAISQKEEPFDVFICYKETDRNGRRTPDSVLANELYHQLTQEGFRVFFSRITLEDQLGVAYEPYIFAALNSAKVMVVLGTKPEYFNAVWVKNEWSRYLALVKQSGGKKILIPAYRDMDPYDLPEEFSHLQAQDMAKLGFMQDLIRGIKKLTQADMPHAAVKETVIVNNGNVNVQPLLKRVFMYLEDGEWGSADEYCEKVLDQEPENALGYLGKLMAEIKCTHPEKLRDCEKPFDGSLHYKRAERFASNDMKEKLRADNAFIRERNERKRLEGLYAEASGCMNRAASESQYKKAAELFLNIKSFKDSEEQWKRCLEAAEDSRQESIYKQADMEAKKNTIPALNSAIRLYESISDWQDAAEMASGCRRRLERIREREEIQRKEEIYKAAKSNQERDTVELLAKAIHLYESITGWKDAEEQIGVCKKRIEELKAKAEAERLERERKAEAERLERERKEELARAEAEKRAKRNKKIAIIRNSILCVVAAFIIILNFVIIPNSKYNDAIALMDNGQIVEAYEALIALDGYKDSAEKASSIYEEYKPAKLKTAKTGDYVFFGAYEQDNDTSNGKEEIEWLVLDEQDGRILVISKYVLECQPYHESYTDVTWETCTLRGWLNDTFLSSAFSEEEKALIPTVTVSADPNPEYSTSPGNATQDKVFLLSITEAKEYFWSNSARWCKETMYAEEQGAGSWWWLRSPGEGRDDAAGVYGDGDFDIDGYTVYNRYFVNYIEGGLRPALWIDQNF